MQSLATPLDDAIVEVSESSYPIIKKLNAEKFVPFSEKIGNLFLDIKPEKLGKAIDLSIDVFNSVPDEKLAPLKATIKESFADLKTDSCTLVPLPSAATADRYKAIAEQNVAPEKIKAFAEKWGDALQSLSKTDGAICLPSSAALDKLSLAQAEVGKSFGAEESKKFAAFAEPLVRAKLGMGTVLSLAGDAKGLTPTATAEESGAFQSAGKKIERIAKEERTRQLQAEARARLDAQRDPAARAAAASDLRAAQKAAAEKAQALKEKQAAEAAEAAKAAKERTAALIAARKQAEAEKVAALKAATEAAREKALQAQAERAANR